MQIKLGIDENKLLQIQSAFSLLEKSKTASVNQKSGLVRKRTNSALNSKIEKQSQKSDNLSQKFNLKSDNSFNLDLSSELVGTTIRYLDIFRAPKYGYKFIPTELLYIEYTEEKVEIVDLKYLKYL